MISVRAASGVRSPEPCRPSGRADRKRVFRIRKGSVHRSDGGKMAGWSWPTAARCSSTKPGTSRWRSSRSCCALCRSGSSSAWAVRAPSASTSGSLRRPIAIWSRWSPKDIPQRSLLRLNVFPVRVPALRERPEDIPALVHHFVEKFSRPLKRPDHHDSESAMGALKRSFWPGNIRELENLIERAVILSSGPELNVPLADLRPALHTGGEPAKNARRAAD